MLVSPHDAQRALPSSRFAAFRSFLFSAGDALIDQWRLPSVVTVHGRFARLSSICTPCSE